jgi:hypothetical protein
MHALRCDESQGCNDSDQNFPTVYPTFGFCLAQLEAVSLSSIKLRATRSWGITQTCYNQTWAGVTPDFTPPRFLFPLQFHIYLKARDFIALLQGENSDCPSLLSYFLP